VFLIDSAAPVSLEEVKASQLPPAKLGETEGVKWLHMVMPGDVDYKGMEYALAVASRGERKAVAMVTSFDTKEPVLNAAIRLARETLAANPIPQHEAVWAKFWSASGLELGDTFFQEAWYRNLYFMRCFCRAGTAMPVTLYAGLAEDRTRWHGAPTLDYNIEQVFWPMFVCNHVDEMEPYVRYLANFAPRGRWLAKETYGLDGLFYPVNIFGPEHLVAPQTAKSQNARQICYVPWSYCLGVTGWGLQNLWLRYQYQPDRAYLESVYPLLRDAAEFYANVLEQCRDGELGPSYNPEHGPFGTFNNPVDIAYFRFLFDAATQAARLLDRDAKLAERWTRQRARVPDYETTAITDGQIVANWKGATANSVRASNIVQTHNIACPTVPIFPAGQVTWFSPPEEKALFERTLRWLKHSGNNSHIMVNVARARFSMPEAYTETRAHFAKIVAPNGLFAFWPGHGYYLAESWAFAGLTAELLLQSVGDVIRVFPAWPKDKDAAFTNLRAQGGFLVTAEQKAGKVVKLEITSTVGGRLRLLSPWTGKLVERETRAGEQFEITP
jgi:alpha-L-fucosidase 2